VLLLLLAECPAAFAQQAVALVVEPGASIYQQAARGFEQGFANASPVEKILLDGNSQEPEAAIDQLRRQRPSLVVAIGTRAARLARSRLPDAPLLYCLALRPSQNNLVGRNTGGVALDLDLSRQLNGIREAFPQMRRLGVVYDDLTSGKVVDDARRYLRPDVELIARPVRTSQEASRALEELMSTVLGSADGFWLLWDPVVANPANFKRLVQLSLTYKVPLIAPARPFVEAGALISIGPDFQKAGVQAGRMARQVLKGELRLDNLEAQPPQELLITVNGEVARRLNVGFPPDLHHEVLAPP
jgi:putative ABC transport system substrate-binding protein